MAPNNLIGSAHIRPIFLGNLDINVTAEDVSDIFTRPYSDMPPMPVERVDLKRGFAFVFMDPAKSEEDKARVETYVERINGMEFPNISKAVRAEFARGDGRVKRKEDDRRKIITPNETLFVVNFSEETTKKEDLEMLFSKFGDLVRIDMKRNYAFVQYTTTEDATKAKDATNGGQLDQNVITVEYVAQRRRDDDRRGGYRGDRDRGYRGGRNDYRGGRRGYDRDYDRRRSPPRGRYDDDRRYRSRSRSPLRNRSRSRSPLGGGRRYRDDRGRDNKFDSRDPPRYGGRDHDARGYR
jgi:arginine/serine-rich splicing factor 4/5/6